MNAKTLAYKPLAISMVLLFAAMMILPGNPVDALSINGEKIDTNTQETKFTSAGLEDDLVEQAGKAEPFSDPDDHSLNSDGSAEVIFGPEYSNFENFKPKSVDTVTTDEVLITVGRTGDGYGGLYQYDAVNDVWEEATYPTAYTSESSHCTKQLHSIEFTKNGSGRVYIGGGFATVFEYDVEENRLILSKAESVDYAPGVIQIIESSDGEIIYAHNKNDFFVKGSGSDWEVVETEKGWTVEGIAPDYSTRVGTGGKSFIGNEKVYVLVRDMYDDGGVVLRKYAVGTGFVDVEVPYEDFAVQDDMGGMTATTNYLAMAGHDDGNFRAYTYHFVDGAWNEIQREMTNYHPDGIYPNFNSENEFIVKPQASMMVFEADGTADSMRYLKIDKSGDGIYYDGDMPYASMVSYRGMDNFYLSSDDTSFGRQPAVYKIRPVINFRDETGEIVLEKSYSAGDELHVELTGDVPLEYETIDVAIVLEIAGQFYAYPDWKLLEGVPDTEEMCLDADERQGIDVMAFTVPNNVPSETYTLYAVGFEQNTFNIRTNIAILPLTFE